MRMLEKCGNLMRRCGDSPGFRFLRRAWMASPGACLVVAVLAVIGILAARTHESGADRRREIASAFGAANAFYGTPQISPDGRQVAFVAAAKTRSSALYLLDVPSGRQREIASESDGLGYWKDDYDLLAWPWAPDGSAFVFTMMDKVVVCSPGRGNGRAELTVGTNIVSQVVWITPDRFAFVEGTTNLCCAQRQPEDQWTLHRLGLNGVVTSLSALPSNHVAWLQEGLICRVNTDKILAGTNNLFAVPDAATNSAVPPSENGLALWMDASTLTLSNGAPVECLRDRSPKANHAYPEMHPPFFNAPDSPQALNGRGTVHFSSNGSLTNATGLKTGRRLGVAGSAPRTVFAVMRRDPGRGKNMLLSTGDPGIKGAYFGLCDQSSGLYVPAGMAADNVFKSSAPRWNILTVVYDGSTQEGYVNGVFKGKTAFPLNTTDAQVELGTRNSKSNAQQSGCSDGDLAELLIYDRVLDYAGQKQVETYLVEKWFAGRLLNDQSALVWFDPNLTGISGLIGSKTSGQALFLTGAGADTALWRHDSKNGAKRIARDAFIENVQWLGDHDLAYICRRSGHRQVVFCDNAGNEKARAFANGDVACFSAAPANGKMAVTGSISNEPAHGIWLCDIESAKARSLVPDSDCPSPLARRVTPFRGSINLGPGRNVNCTIYPPTTVVSGRRYPLVIGDTLLGDAIHGSLFLSGMAACGAYVAVVERPSWYAGIEQWGTNVLSLCNNLKPDPAIDPHRIYLFAASAETRYLSDLVEQKPDLWKGVMLLNPGILPDFSKANPFLKRPKVLVSVGGEEQAEERLRKFQEDALRSGALVEFIIHPGETHRLFGKTAKLDRIRKMEQFIFEE